VAGVAVGMVSLLLWGALETAQERTLARAVQQLGQAVALRLADRLVPCHAGDVRLPPPAAAPMPGPSIGYRFELPLAPGPPDEGCRSALQGLRRSFAEVQAGAQPYLLLELVGADAVRSAPASAALADQDDFALPAAPEVLRLRASAAPALVAAYRSPLPVLFLVCGLFLAGSTSLALAQLLRSREQARALSRAAAELRAEIARRDTLQGHLQSANQRLDDFAYIASHDLKEPLRGLTNLAGFLLDDHGERLGEEGRERLLSLQAQARRMSGLISDLLEYSRAGAGGGSFKTVDLDRLLSEVLERLAPELVAQGIRPRRGAALGRVQGDRAQLRMVFEYLIDNAARYSDRNDRQVAIEVRAGPPRTYMVIDNGIGIAEEHRERIFRMFTRLHHRDEYGGGSGAGLSIARKIVEAHGGRLWVESRPDGQRGSVFCFTLGDGLAPASPPIATETR